MTMPKYYWKNFAQKALLLLESAVLFPDYHSWEGYLSSWREKDRRIKDSLFRINKLLKLRLVGLIKEEPEITAFIYSKADERMLIPLLLRLLQQIESNQLKIKVNLILLTDLNQELKEQLVRRGCNLDIQDYSSLIKACFQPKRKLLLLCLDHRLFYELGTHRLGVNAADHVRKFGVKTVSIQHGGIKEDSLKGLASSASDIVLIWGERVSRELVNQYGVDPNRLRIVGNPLHDQISLLDKEQIFTKIDQYYPKFSEIKQNKKIILLATCMHSEYAGRENELEMYANYLKHLYASLDFSQIILIIKKHPNDNIKKCGGVDLYQEMIPDSAKTFNSIFIVEPENNILDVYSLLYISDLLITRASTVAEEGLLMNKKVIAFDLDEAGPAKYYQHLEEYGNYSIVYASPEKDLRNAIQKALFSVNSQEDRQLADNLEIEKDITYSLDGKSTERAANEILKILNS